MTPIEHRTCELCGCDISDRKPWSKYCKACYTKNKRQRYAEEHARKMADPDYREAHLQRQRAAYNRRKNAEAVQEIAKPQPQPERTKRDYSMPVVFLHDPDEDAGFPRLASLPKKEFHVLLEQGWITTGAIVLKNDTRYQVSGRELVRI